MKIKCVDTKRKQRILEVVRLAALRQVGLILNSTQLTSVVFGRDLTLITYVVHQKERSGKLNALSVHLIQESNPAIQDVNIQLRFMLLSIFLLK